MSKKKYNLVTQEEFKKGAIYSLVNAYELYGDALIMDALGRTPRTYSLMKLSLEEITKALMLFEIYLLKQYVELFQERISTLLKGLEDHNSKTKYAIEILISKQNEFIKYHPNPEVKNEYSNQKKELNELIGLLENVTNLDKKKNTNLYTDLFGNEFKPPSLSVNNNDVHSLRQLTLSILLIGKSIIVKEEDEFYVSLGINPEKLKKLDPNSEARKMHKIQAVYLNFFDDLKSIYPHFNLDQL